MKTITVYEFNELSEEAKEKARAWYREAAASDNYSLDEMLESLKAVFKVLGYPMKDWSIGPYNRGNFLKVDLGDANDLTGKRALAWLENNLFDQLRITPAQFKTKQKEYMSYGTDYRPGNVPPCPLTGVCYDDDLLDALRKDVIAGETLKDALQGLADKVQAMNEAEIEYQNEDAQVDEMLIANGYTFNQDGKREG